MADYNEFRVQVTADYPTSGTWDVQLLACPLPGLAGPKGTIRPVFTRRQLRRLRNRNDWPNQDELIGIGRGVWQSLMTPELAPALRSSRELSRAQGKALQITVTALGAEQRDEAGLSLDDPVRLAELPVEALYDDTQGFLATDLQSPICRGLQAQPDRQPKQAKLPLHLLVAVAVTRDTPEASARQELAAIQSALQPWTSTGAVTLDAWDHPTKPELLQRLQSCDIFHFIGHGGFEPVAGDPTSQAYIALCEVNGSASSPLTAYDLDNILRNTGVQLVVFTACSSAAIDPDEEPYPVGAFNGMAQRLLSGLSGVTAAVAMQFDMETDAAVAFSQTFYQHLLEPDKTLADAVTLARKQVSVVKGAGHRAWVTPTAYCRAQGGKVFALPQPESKTTATAELSSEQRRNKKRPSTRQPKGGGVTFTNSQIYGPVANRDIYMGDYKQNIADRGAQQAVGGDGAQQALGRDSAEQAVGRAGPQPVVTQSGLTAANLEQVKKLVDDLKAAVDAEHVSPSSKADLQGMVDKVHEELTVKDRKPDADRLVKAGKWLADAGPKVLGALTSVFVSPVVGKVVEAAGEVAKSWVMEQFGTGGQSKPGGT